MRRYYLVPSRELKEHDRAGAQSTDELARLAEEAGLLTDAAIQRLIEEAMRRDAGRCLLETVGRIHAANVPPLTEEEIVAEVKAARAERRQGRKA